MIGKWSADHRLAALSRGGDRAFSSDREAPADPASKFQVRLTYRAGRVVHMEQAQRAAPIDIRRAQTAAPGAPVLELVETPPPALKARQLFEEARAISLDHLRALDIEMTSVCDLLDAVAQGGDLYAPGLREFARKLTEDLSYKTKTLRMLTQRQAAPINRA
jgi:hypothetical protein